MPENIKFNIDDKVISAKPGQTILQAAMDEDIYIPYLCYYPKMKPQGSCRACMVEVTANGRTIVGVLYQMYWMFLAWLMMMVIYGRRFGMW